MGGDRMLSVLRKEANVTPPACLASQVSRKKGRQETVDNDCKKRCSTLKGLKRQKRTHFSEIVIHTAVIKGSIPLIHAIKELKIQLWLK